MGESSISERILTGLQATQERLWGANRNDALAPSLQRIAEALTTVERLRIPDGVEPFPTGPEEPRG